METRIDPATTSVLQHHRILQEIGMFREVWAKALDHLKFERTALMDAIEENGDEADDKLSLRMLVLEYKMAMYEMCIDRANEREEILDHRPNLDREGQRARFFRLMGAMAKADNDRSEQNDYLHFVATPEQDAWLGDRWFCELEVIAAEARRQLVTTTH